MLLYKPNTRKQLRFDRKRHNRRVFIKTFIISFALLSIVVIAGGFMILRSNIQPPAVPDAREVLATVPFAENPNDGYTTSPAYIVPEPEAAYLSEIPVIYNFEDWDRKPNFYTFVIFGLDEGNNVDAIIVAAYNGETRQGYIISIPRDTRVDVQRNSRKIVSSYPVGMLRGGGHEGGVKQLKLEVQSLIGFRPDFYVSVSEEIVINVVDAVGGVEIYVPFHKLYDDPCQNLHINIPAGQQRLDGINALHFARYRLGNNRRYNISDYQRIENQQQIVAAVLQELLHPRTILRVPSLINAYQDNVDTNLSLGEKLWFAEQLAIIRDVNALSLYTLPTAGTSGPPAWYELPCARGIIELVNRTVNPFTQDITEDMLKIAS